jgi:SAM-dependent methyltransferase
LIPQIITLVAAGNAERYAWENAYISGRAAHSSVWVNEPGLARFASQFAPRHAHVLVPGCGSGNAIRALCNHRPDLSFSGLDFSHEALHLAYAGSLPIERLYQHDLNRFPWPIDDDECDVVMATEILEHLNDPTRALAECRRIAKSAVIVTLPVAEELTNSPLHRWRFEMSDAAELLGPDREVETFRDGGLVAAAVRTNKQ